jgi:hypothetical protein
MFRAAGSVSFSRVAFTVQADGKAIEPAAFQQRNQLAAALHVLSAPRT